MLTANDKEDVGEAVPYILFPVLRTIFLLMFI
jgi:hypothetical protein